MLETTGIISNKDIEDSEIVNRIVEFVAPGQISVEIHNLNVKDSTVINNVTIALSRSLEYEDLLKTQKRLEKLLARIPADEAQERLEVSAELSRHREVLVEFVRDVLAVARQFNRIEINTERLRRARELFDEGKFSEGRAILELEVEQARDEESLLLVRRDEYETDIAPKLKTLAESRAALAALTLVDYTNPNRLETACGHFEQSIKLFADESTVFFYAYLLARYNRFAEAEKYYRHYLREFSGKIPPADRATTLNNLANLHTNLNKYDEALDEYDDALRLYRELAATDPETHLADVVMTLNNRAFLHKWLGKYDEALKEYDEALNICRSFALVETASKAAAAEGANPAENKRFFLATTLNNLGNLSKDLHRYDRALKEYGEALPIYRSLAAAAPKTYQRYVAAALNNLALLHQRQNEFAIAGDEYAEALGIYRELYAADPYIYLPSLSGALTNLANLHLARENYDAALREYEEAVGFYRSLAVVDPEAFQPYVAMTLNNLAVLHQNRERFAEAARAFEETLEIQRALAAAHPEAYLPYVAGTLNNMATLYHKQGKAAEALPKYEETLKIRRALHARTPEAYAPDLAMTLMNLAMFHQSPAPDREKSIACAAEAVVILTPLSPTVPAAASYTQSALVILMDWGLTDEEIQRLIME
ncbi:MAG TPA: tetratricopeptide repeat protein, partial [Pyrinomonadaceae bacterium]|nr:tetratricopeptide repeat protein [Pyrinomonadaceae bacterium]